MLTVQETSQMEKAGRVLLPQVLSGANWLSPSHAPRSWKVGQVSVRASMDVTPLLEVFLHIAFRGPGLSPMKAVDMLEAFLKSHLPLAPNSEWHVEVDGQNWIHFSRRWVSERLSA